jgi:hypothetical protein
LKATDGEAPLRHWLLFYGPDEPAAYLSQPVASFMSSFREELF